MPIPTTLILSHEWARPLFLKKNSRSDHKTKRNRHQQKKIERTYIHFLLNFGCIQSYIHYTSSTRLDSLIFTCQLSIGQPFTSGNWWIKIMNLINWIWPLRPIYFFFFWSKMPKPAPAINIFFSRPHTNFAIIKEHNRKTEWRKPPSPSNGSSLHRFAWREKMNHQTHDTQQRRDTGVYGECVFL